jgi:hypothetical protein
MVAVGGVMIIANVLSGSIGSIRIVPKDISKILWPLTPSKSLLYDSETSPCQTSTTAGGGGGAQQQHDRSSSGGGGVTLGVEKRRKFCQSWVSQTPSTPQQTQSGNRKKSRDYNFSTEIDIQEIVVLEILGATHLPKLKNSTSPSTLTPHKSNWHLTSFVRTQ